MGSDSGGGYSGVEVLAVIIVLADIPVIAVAVVVGPLYALAFAAVFVVGGVLAWYLSRRLDAVESASDTAAGEPANDGGTDPVTELQRRYAAGELSESEFESKLDRLVDAEKRAEEAGVDTEELSLDRMN